MANYFPFLVKMTPWTAMPFRLADWKRLRARLGLASRHLAEFRAAAKEVRAELRHLLDEAINALHAVAEYAVNASLELHGQTAETGHRAGQRAQELHALGHLKKDYRDVLEQLEKYRKFAQYAGYGRSGSTHYNATNVEDCLLVVVELFEETDIALRVAGKVTDE
jgi:hypothetical protein